MLELGRCILDVLQILDARREAECQVPHALVVAVLADVQRELPPATSCTTQRSGQDGTKRRARTLLLTCRQRSRLQAPLVKCPQMLSLTQMHSCYFLDARNAGRIGTSMPVASLLRFPRAEHDKGRCVHNKPAEQSTLRKQHNRGCSRIGGVESVYTE